MNGDKQHSTTPFSYLTFFPVIFFSVTTFFPVNFFPINMEFCTSKVFVKMTKFVETVGERNGSVEECLTRDRGAAGSSLTALCA